jgi:ABC-type multidrug transport system fused ATPase/permease subunit
MIRIFKSIFSNINEYKILESVTKKLSNSKTFIIISHRSNTLKKFCDKVFELSNNKLVLKYQKN